MNNQSSKPNIVFFVMDAVRARNLGCYGYGRETSPIINGLAEKGVLFENAFSYNNTTDRSFVSILGGRSILSSGDLNFLLRKEEMDSFFGSGGIFLQEILKKSGYKTFCLMNITNWRKRGFDYYFNDDETKKVSMKDVVTFIKKSRIFSAVSKLLFYYVLPRKITDKIRIRRDSSRSVDEAVRIIRERNEKDPPFFVYIHCNDAHMPYNAPGKFAHKFGAGTKTRSFFKEISSKNYNKALIDFYKTVIDRRDSIEDISLRYDCAIAYDDYLMGKVIGTLKDKRLLDSTIIIIISDHGESLGEHDIYFDHHGLYDVTTHVPFIIVSKQLPKKKRIKAFVQLEDIAPTILDLIGIKYDSSVFDGKGLLSLINGQEEKLRDYVFMEETYLYRKAAIRDYKYRYIEAPSKEEAFCKRCKIIHGGAVELYDLEKDPKETKNIANKNKDIVISMSLKLNKVISEIKGNNERRRIRRAVNRVES